MTCATCHQDMTEADHQCEPQPPVASPAVPPSPISLPKATNTMYWTAGIHLVASLIHLAAAARLYLVLDDFRTAGTGIDLGEVGWLEWLGPFRLFHAIAPGIYVGGHMLWLSAARHTVLRLGGDQNWLFRRRVLNFWIVVGILGVLPAAALSLVSKAELDVSIDWLVAFTGFTVVVVLVRVALMAAMLVTARSVNREIYVAEQGGSERAEP